MFEDIETESESASNTTGRIDLPVMGIGVGATLLFVVALIVDTQILGTNQIAGLATEINTFLWQNLGFLYLVVMFIFLVFVAFLLISPWGSTKLGDGEPEYSYPLYFAMLFSAGIAAGIVFWGPSEAIFHFGSVPPYIQNFNLLPWQNGATPSSNAAALGAVKYTMFHWGFSAWAAYAVIGIPIAYYAYNHDAPFRVSTILAPVLGLKNLDGWAAKVVDVLAVFATLGGLTTTLGLISSQFLDGASYAFGAEVGAVGTVIVIAGFTLIFAVSVVTGVNRGIKRIALVNVTLFALLAVGVFLAGPTLEILSMTGLAFGQYLVEVPFMSLYPGGEGSWVASWTVFYWAWWLSWAPFVGLFMARISKGRTIREVVLAGVVAPTLATLAWFGIMGNTAISFTRNAIAPISDVMGEFGYAVAGFPLFNALPLSELFMVSFLGLAITFLVTSADTATLSLSMLTTHGDRKPMRSVRILWASVVGILAATVLITQSANALQQAAIITGGPFAVIALISIAGMVLEFSGQRQVGVSAAEKADEMVDSGSTTGTEEPADAD